MQQKILCLVFLSYVSFSCASYSGYVYREQEGQVATSIKCGESFNSVRRQRESGSEVATQADQNLQYVGETNQTGNGQYMSVLQRVVKNKRTLQETSDEQGQCLQVELQSRDQSPNPSSQQTYYDALHREEVEIDFDKGVTKKTSRLDDWCTVKISKDTTSDKVLFEADKLFVEKHNNIFNEYSDLFYKSFCRDSRGLFVRLYQVDDEHFVLELGENYFQTCKYEYLYSEGFKSSENLLKVYLGNSID